MNLKLDHQLALVTASSGGIGLEIARALAAEGARVIINGRSAANVDAAIATLRRDLPDAKLERLISDNGTAAGTEQTIAQFPLTDGVAKFVQDLFPGLSVEEAGRRFMRENRPTSLIERLLRPEEIAALVTFLSSPLASGINGAAFRVDGGLVRSVF